MTLKNDDFKIFDLFFHEYTTIISTLFVNNDKKSFSIQELYKKDMNSRNEIKIKNNFFKTMKNSGC